LLLLNFSFFVVPCLSFKCVNLRFTVEAFSPLDPIQMRLHRDLKAAFDPAGILNPGRVYAQL